MKLVVVGCGHIGGSAALAFRAAGGYDEIVGVERDARAAARAVELGLVDRLAATVEAAAADADLIVIAVPPGAVGGVLAACARAGGAAVVTDVAGLKAEIVALGEAALGGRFVGGHPMAGHEGHGPDAADATLFRGRVLVLTPGARTDPAALAKVRAAWEAAGARVVEKTPAEHDALVAALSQLPHVVAYALAGVVGKEAGVAGLAGGSFASGTRVAASDPALWRELLVANRAELLPWIDALAGRVGELRAAIAAGDEKSLEALLEDGRRGRARVLS